MTDGTKIGLAVGTAMAGGNILGGTIVAVLNHGYSTNAVVLLAIGIALDFTAMATAANVGQEPPQ